MIVAIMSGIDIDGDSSSAQCSTYNSELKNTQNFIFTVNNSIICVLRFPKLIPTLPTRSCVVSTMKRRPVPALQTQGVVRPFLCTVETHFLGVETLFGGLSPFLAVLRPIFGVLRPFFCVETHFAQALIELGENDPLFIRLRFRQPICWSSAKNVLIFFVLRDSRTTQTPCLEAFFA